MRKLQSTMFLRTLCIAVYTLSFIFGAFADNSSDNKISLPTRELRDLSSAIKAASTYRMDLRRNLDSVEDSLSNASSDAEKCTLSLRLAKLFRPVNTDSSIYYADRAQELARSLDTHFRQRASIAVIDGLSTAGLFTESLNLLKNLSAQKLSPDIKLEYWLAGRRLYGYMKGYAEGNQMCYNRYDSLYQNFDDSLILHLPRQSHLREFLTCERLVSENLLPEAQRRLDKLLSSLPQENNLYAMAAYQMAEVWKKLGNESRYAAMLAVSALCDVKNCVTEGLALPTLAEWLYRHNEFDDSFAFINFALEEASVGNVRMRAVTIARFVPLIDEAYRDNINSSRDELMVYFLLVTILLIITGVLIMFLIKQIKRTRATAQKLAITSRRQESYIGNFIGLYSSYADRLNHLARLVSTKLASGQVTELKKLMDSGRFSEQDNDDIHKIFDAAFLDLYPNFVENVNALLRPEEAIKLKESNSLTPELRIYAFVKLGVEESTRIAQILHYSANTVYAYRNKMRNKAIIRDTFDSDIKDLS